MSGSRAHSFHTKQTSVLQDLLSTSRAEAKNALTALQALGPRFQHLHLSLGCNRAFNASGISALPQCLKGLHLHGILDIGELEMKVRLRL
eukprot:scaffold251737_cov14-Tisochrysis_lutea.AAC.1